LWIPVPPIASSDAPSSMDCEIKTNFVRHHSAIDDSEDDGIGYDMIIGKDLCRVIGMDICYGDCTLQMNGRTVTKKNNHFPICRGMLSSRELKQVIA
jgi:hypothetical protein